MPDNPSILKGIRVLVLEDEQDTRDLLGIVLGSHGATPILTGNVSQALQFMQTQQPIDVVIADIGMPDYNGYAFIAALRKDQGAEIRNTPVIVLTAYSTPADRDTALISGFNEYLAKPFDPGVLTSTIRRLYDEHHRDAAA